ncbi:2796_t:CDS:1, partial [Racocetra fulgida]
TQANTSVQEPDQIDNIVEQLDNNNLAKPKAKRARTTKAT